MEIRRAVEADIPELLSLLVQVCNVHHRIRPDIFRADGVKYDRQALVELLADEDRPVFAAVEEGRLLGYCFCQWRDCRGGSGVSTDRLELYIDDLCVHQEFRGRGTATALYRYVTDYARARKCSFITLNVWQGNEGALEFYEKMGLRPRNITMEMALEGPVC